MVIKFLKAGRGDSILLRSNGQNMIIDGGDDSSYLLGELDAIKKEAEVLNAVVITHHDSDHIRGIIDFFNELKTGRYGNPLEFVKRVYFNSPRLIKGVPISKTSNLLSYKQASEIEKLISEIGLICDTTLTDTSNSLEIGEIRLTCLSPTKEIIDGYADSPKAYLTSNLKCDWDKNLNYLEKFIHDKSLDNSVPNKSSIVLKLEYNDKLALLTGDITPARFEEIADSLFKQNDEKPVKFDFIKLPHHGSYRSISRKILEKFDCQCYLISTDGNNSCLPNKKAILKVVKYQSKPEKKISFLFNYSKTLENLRISSYELKKYNIQLIPNNSKSGYCI